MTYNKKNLWVAVGIVAAVVIIAALWRGGTPAGENGPLGGSSRSTKHTETTAVAGTYQCAGGKSFTLTVLADGTARVSGANSAGVVLHKSDAAAIWISADASVAVREIADYTVLIENDTITRDRCHLR